MSSPNLYYGLLHNLNDVVLTAKAVRASPQVAGVVVPLPINPEAVFIAAWGNHHGLAPHAIFVHTHGVRFGVPLVEVAHQNDLLRFGHFQHEFDVSMHDHIFLCDTGHNVNLLLHLSDASRLQVDNGNFYAYTEADVVSTASSRSGSWLAGSPGHFFTKPIREHHEK